MRHLGGPVRHGGAPEQRRGDGNATTAAAADRGHPHHAYSRRVCIEASLASRGAQDVLDRETAPGGQLHALRWRVTSLMNHQSLTATMVLCPLLLQLRHRRSRDEPEGEGKKREDETEDEDEDEEIAAALRRARGVWARRSAGSDEARKAAETVSIVLARAGEGRGAIFDGDEGRGAPGVVHQGLPSEMGFGEGLFACGTEGFFHRFYGQSKWYVSLLRRLAGRGLLTDLMTN